MEAPASYQLFVGIDVAARSFTASWAPTGTVRPRARTFEQSPEGFTALLQQLHDTGVAPAQALVVLEATGTYWIKLAVTLHHASYAVSVANPKHVHNFAKSLTRRSKTDALDANMLAQFAAERKPAPWTPPPAVYHELRQRLMTRDALLEMRQQARNQRHALQQWPIVVAGIQDRFDDVIATLDAQLVTLDQEIAATLEAGAWADSAHLLLSIPGVGVQCTAWLLVSTLNFALCATPQAATAYAGLDPVHYESGTSVRGQPHIGRGGNARLRKVLYMASLSAGQHNPLIRTFYRRLRDNGKPAKVAQCAAARKLLHLAWAVVAHRRRFDPAYGRQQATATGVTGLV